MKNNYNSGKLKKNFFNNLWQVFFAILFLLNLTASAQDFMMQGWYWDYPKPDCNSYNGPSLAAEMAAKAEAQKNAGFTMIWMPPMTNASFGYCSNGYDPRDL